MKLLTSVISLLCASTAVSSKQSLDHKEQQKSIEVIDDKNFKPPPVWKNSNLLRTINLEKAYPRETLNVVIENIDSKPQDVYYLAMPAGSINHISGFEVQDKKNPSAGFLEAKPVKYDHTNSKQYYHIRLPSPLKKKSQQTLSITYNQLSAVTPVPKSIKQVDNQYLRYSFSAYAPSAYQTVKQKTTVKFGNADVPDYTVLTPQKSSAKEDPERKGTTFTYGPYNNLPAGAEEEAVVRYQFTHPLIRASKLERDVEVSHWGGNLATEERYWFSNHAAKLENHFSRLSWAQTSYYNPPTSAIREFKMPLHPGALNPYFTDDIGNVSTSRFRKTSREAMLEYKPRYPVFGGWNYSYRLGWDNSLGNFLRKSEGSRYVLRVPFIEGPKMGEGVEYSDVVVRFILPEGAIIESYNTAVPLSNSSQSLHHTFMDTLGRTTLTLRASNIDDTAAFKDVLITYSYPAIAAFRKPLTMMAGMLAVLGLAYVLGSVDTSIGRRK